MADHAVVPAQNLSTLTADSWSPAIWSKVPFEDLLSGRLNRKYGIAFEDNFQDFPLAGTQTTQIGHGKYKVFNTGAAVISRVSAVGGVEVPGGVLQNALDTDNDSGSIAQSYPSLFISGDKTTMGKTFVEIIYAQNSIVTNFAAVFLGLAEVEQWTLATGVPFNGGDAITNSASAVGYRVEEDGLGVIDTVYSDRATSFTNIGDTEGGTLVANTFTQLGMVFDPYETDNFLTFYVNNRPASTRMSRAAWVALTNADANSMGLLYAACADTAGTTYTGFLKGWRYAQYAPGFRG